jgi:Domain of unknown function (DUF222)
MREKPSTAELVTLGEQIAEQAVHLDAAMHRLLADLHRFDEAGGWLAQGFTSCAHWLSHRVGWDLATAREHLRVAGSLAELPQVAAALASGTLSYSKARAITRVADPTNEHTLLQYAEVSTASQMETICRKFRAAQRPAGASRQALPRDDDRYVVSAPTASGLVCVKAFLLPDEAALLEQAIHQAARDCRAPRDEEPPPSPDVSVEDTSDRSAHSGTRATHSYNRKLNRADGLMALVQAYVRGGSPNRAPIEMIITAPAETLRAADSASTDATTTANATTSTANAATTTTNAPTDSLISPTDPHDRGASIPVAIVAESNTYLPSATARRLACDCGVVEAAVDPQGQPLSVGRKARTIPAAIKRALLLRDRTCRFPGCDHRLFLDGHHVQHWADGGETSLSNTLLLCTPHHARVHEHGYCIIPSDTGELTFLDSRGHRVIAVPSRPSPPDLGWPAIRAANAALPLSAETSVDVGRQGCLDHKEAVGRLLRVQPRIRPPADGTQAHHAAAATDLHASRPAPAPWPAAARPESELTSPGRSPALEEPRRRNEFFADPDYDFDAAGYRADHLLEWSMDELRATGIDPMATVPAPIWPPPSWYESKQRPVPGPAWNPPPPPPRGGSASRKRSRTTAPLRE